MRTTLTIDDDVAALLERLRRARKASLKDLVNDALRRGLRDMTATPKPRPRFLTRTIKMELIDGVALDNVAEALALAEGDRFK